MSRIGKNPVSIPDGVKIKLSGLELAVEGSKGKLTRTFHPEMTINVEDDKVVITRNSDSKFHRSLHGTTRALIQNMVTGVTAGYSKRLEIVGVQYRAELKGKYLFFPAKAIGYSHAVLVKPPDGVNIEYLYSSLINEKGSVVIIFKVEDIDHGLEIVEKAGLEAIASF